MPLSKKLKNIWDYDKWYILIGIAVFVAAIIFVKDVVFKEKFDFRPVYVGSGYLSNTEQEQFNSVLAEYAFDCNDDGKVNVKTKNIEFSALGSLTGNSQMDRESATKLMAEFTDQENCIFIADEERITKIAGEDNEAITDLSTLCPSLPEGTRYLKFSETVAYKELSFLPDNLVIAVRKPYMNKYLPEYERSLKFVSAILNSN